ncbi:MAG: ATP-dependent Clp protease ATP-binding subunit ClpA, partial [Gammaproteobacteria bacterium]|nr:ATP-dependent Clp protease ATP-binding subunit ClpA [Gammaproteobacteria bacterium]
MLSKELEASLNIAFNEARNKRHEYITVEHLLLALLDNASANSVLKACGADLLRLKNELAEYLEENTPVFNDSIDGEVQPTLGFQRVLQRAVFHVQSSGKKEVTGANVLVAIFGEQESQAVYLLHQQDVSRLDIVNYVSHGISKVSDENEEADIESGEDISADNEKQPLENFATNLNMRALQNKIDPLIG